MHIINREQILNPAWLLGFEKNIFDCFSMHRMSSSSAPKDGIKVKVM